MGFFSESTLAKSKAPPSLVARCDACGLYKACKSPKMPVTGDGRRGILVIAEAPGITEDAQGKQLVGKAGQYLRTTLRKFGVDLDRDCWKTNAIICRTPKDRGPTDKELSYCLPNVLAAIKELRPTTILLLGSAAVRSVIGHYWKESPGSITRWVGWQIPCQQTNAWVCPTYHPSYLEREKDPVLDLIFEDHIKSAVEHEGSPWGEDGPTELRVECITDEGAACERIRRFSTQSEPVAIDYETDRLKPECADTRIVCCALSTMNETIAYPWTSKTRQATIEFAKSPVPKVAANMKFEQRWSKRHLGGPMRNWIWDTMQTAHVLDNRQGVTGLKFQAYVRMGQPPYNDHIEELLRGPHPNERNRIHEIELQDLLRYCAMDALLEIKLYNIQKQELRN